MSRLTELDTLPAELNRPPELPAVDPRAHFAAIVESSDDAIVSKDLDGTILSWNTAASRIFGYQAEEIIGRSILTLIPPELHHEEEKILRKLRAGERIEHYETTRIRKNGERFPISVTISPIRDTTGKIVAASKIARDISDRRKLDENRFRLAAIVESADDAIIGKDLNGIVKSWNEGAHRMFGYTAEEMIGQPILRLIPEELHYEEDEILRKLRAGQRIEHYETTRRKKSGETLEVSITISPIKDESGTVIGASKIARDISDRKRLQSLMLQSEKLAATGRMAAAIAHEVNNPLESLINLVFLARQNCELQGNVHKLLMTAEEEIVRIAHIARQTLGYYRDSGDPVEMYIHDLLENVLLVYKSKIMAKRIAVHARFNDLQKIWLCKGEMLQVFSNVIANSIDAMRDGGVLTVSTQQILGTSHEAVQIAIQDNGAGIHPEHIAKVFEAFFTTKENTGTGIGLWVTKELVERRGGQISIASSTNPEDSGTTVTILIPFAFPASTSGVNRSKVA